MFFTREDIEKIHQGLLRLGIKDSELPETINVNSDDTLAVVQDGKNKKINIEEFFNNISLFKKEGFINITDRFNKHSISLIEAIQTVPTHQRIDGLVITFEDINGDWRIYQFRGDAVDFFDENKWTDLYDYTNYIVKSITPDEEDLTVSKPDKNGNAIVSLKDRVYDESNFSGKGYKILRKNIQTIDGVRKNILTQDMINKSNTIYEIRYDFDLNEKEIILKEGCLLYFKGGRLKNGEIYFNNTSIIGDLKFHNCYLNNEIVLNTILSDTSFTGDTKYDSSILKFLLLNTAKNNGSLIINRDYNISIDDYSYAVVDEVNTKTFILIKHSNGFEVNFNGHTIYENSKDYTNNHNFIHLYRCNNVSILNLKYIVTLNNNILNPYEDDNASGAIPIKTNGDCGNCNFEVSAENVGSCVRCGEFGIIDSDNLGNPTPNYVYKGLYNSKLKVTAYNSGYSCAIYTGENIEIKANFNKIHRGVYLAGANDANVIVNGKNVKTPTLVLIKDSVYYDTNDSSFRIRKYKECKNINLSVTDTGSTNDYTSMVSIESYNDYYFTERTVSYNFSNINVKLYSINNGNISRGIVINSRDLNNNRDKVEVFLSNLTTDKTFTVLSSVGDGDVSLNISNCYMPKCTINIKSPHFINIENSIFYTFVNKVTKESFVILKNSELNSISTDNDESKSSIKLINTKITNGSSPKINCFAGLSLVEGENLNFNEGKLLHDIYYNELSIDTTIKFDVSKLLYGSYRIFYIKNIAKSPIYITFTNAILAEGESTIKVLQNEIIKIVVLTQKNLNKAKIILTHNINNYFLSGRSSLRPSKAIESSTYFDTDLNQMLYYNGNSWINAYGELADIKTSGTFIDKPKPKNIGFQYFNTDTHKIITWDGSKWWNPDGTEATN